MNIDLNLYKIFYVVAKNGNITKASNELFISQPAVTQAIKNLENTIGATLFIRTKKGVTLTEEAKILYEFIKTGLTYISNGETKFKELMNIETGTLKIGASTTITEHVLLKYLHKYQNLYPHISISITNNLTSELIKLLKDGSLDLLILNLPTPNHPDLTITPFLKVHDAFMVAPKLSHLTKKPQDLTDLQNYDFIFQKFPSNTRTFLNNYLTQNNLNITPKYDIVSFNLVKLMTKMGLGIGYITKEFAIDELRNKTLLELQVKPSLPSREIGLATLKNVYPSFAARAFIDLLIPNNSK